MSSGITWLTDLNGNRCSVEYFGSRDAAQNALDSLKNCVNCTNCSDCSRCSRCSGCSGCSGVIGRKGDITPSSVVPKIDNIHQKVLAAVSQPNALDMKSWHTCDTAHCRAGWVVTIAGGAGKALEAFHNTPLAASLIYKASSPLRVTMPRFYETDKEAMADMNRLAKEESQAVTG